MKSRRTFPPSLVALRPVLALIFLVGTMCAQGQWRYPSSGSWPPPSGYWLSGYTNQVGMDAKVYEDPSRIDVRLFITGDIKIYRKAPEDTSWGTPRATVSVTTAPYTFSDTDVEPGVIYEYGVGPAFSEFANHYGNVMAGIRVDRTEFTDRMAIVVAEDILERMPEEFAQYKVDLEDEGWVLHQIVTPRADDYYANKTGTNALASVTVTNGGTGYTTGQHVQLSNGTTTALATLTVSSGVITAVNVTYGVSGFTPGQALTLSGNTTGSGAVLAVNTVASYPAEHINIRNQLIDIYNAHPGELKNVVLVGKVAVARSGTGYTGPDGHGNKASVAADAYYADMDGVWTDTGNNLNSYTGSARGDAINDGRINVAGDNKFDPTYFTQVTNPNSKLELGFGRIDLSNEVPGEYTAMKLYFNKLHRYKRAAADFRPGRKVVNRFSAPPTGDTVQAAMIRNMPALVGMENIDFIRNTDPDSSPRYSSDEDRDSAYTRENGPFLFYFKGGEAPNWSPDGRAVFWTGLQSHWGYWFIQFGSSGYNSMQRRLGEDNFALSFTWSIWGTDYLYHRLGMNHTAGDMMRLSLSDRLSSSTIYAVTSSGASLFMNHMGCPSLRLFMFPGPKDLSILPGAGQAALTWQAAEASPEGEAPILGYHVYRSSSPHGPYLRITDDIIPGTTYIDDAVAAGTWHYQVKAVRLEQSGGGTYYHASLGVRQSVDLTDPPAALAISTSSVEDAYWDTSYRSVLHATGGIPVYAWTQTSGELPPGLTLHPDGTLSGIPTASGNFDFTFQATDQLGQSVEKALSMSVSPNRLRTIFAEANTYITGFNSSKWAFRQPALFAAGPVYLYQPFLRFPISGLESSNRVVKARLVLSFDERNQSNSYAILQAALTQITGQDWTEGGITWDTRPLDDTSIAPIRATAFSQAYETIELDVTPFVHKTLQENPEKKLGLRLFTNFNSSFGNEIRITSRYAPGTAAPHLLIETTDAPQIDFLTPTVNPAAIQVGSALALEALVTPLPEWVGNVTLAWTQVAGPAAATLSSTNTAATHAVFPAVGAYTFRLTAHDGVLSSHEDLRVLVMDIPAATTAALGTDDGLLVRLALDETSGPTATDHSGHASPTSGVLSQRSGSTLPAWAPADGRIGGALSFSQEGQRVEVADSAAKPLDGFEQLTVSAWIKMSDFTGSATALIVKRNSTSSSTTSYALTLANTRRLTATFGTSNVTNTGAEQLAVGEWYHVAMTFDGSLDSRNVKVYLNGLPYVFGHVNLTTLARRDTTPLRVADYTTGAVTNSLSFKGLMDEVRVYNRALNLAEITELAAAHPENVGPLIVMGGPAEGVVDEPMEIAATVLDDGQPAPLDLLWVREAGAGSVSFADATAATTTAQATAAGDYTLRLYANDGSITTWKDLLAVVTGVPLNPAYADWLQANGMATDGSGSSHPTASLAQDGVANAVKFALGLPANAQRYGGRLVTGTVEEGGEQYLSLTYTIPDPPPEGVGYQVNVSPNLEGWSDNVVEVSNVAMGGLRVITVRDQVPMSDPGGERFIQLEINLE